MNHTVIGIFDNESEANNAVDQLVNSGMSRSNIDYCSKNASASKSTSDDTNDHDKFNNFFGTLLDKDEEVNNYSHVASRGCTVTVHASSLEEAQRAADVLDRFGAVDVNERAQQFKGSGELGRTTGAAAGSTNAIPVIEENMQVGKQVVQTGGVRLRSRIIERPVEEHLRLREEHVHIERHPVNKSASTADLNDFRESTIEVRETAEVPMVNKEARVVEELKLSKEVEEHDEVIRDNVRHTEVEVENFDGDDTTDRSSFTNNLHSETDTDTDFLDTSHKEWTNALHRMREVEDDYKVASDDPDVRGWDVIDSSGTKLGEVDELIVDTKAMKVRYLEVDIDNNLFDVDDDHHILLPIGAATLDHDKKNVMVSTLNKQTLASYPAYRGETISRDYEHGLMSALSPGYQSGTVTNDLFYEGQHFDSGRFYGSKKS